MKLREIFLLLVLLFLTGSCKEISTEPPPEEDIVPQFNISWPSLADTPWPMYHHDPQSTGRSKYIGPQYGNITQINFAEFSTMSGISIGYNKTAFLPASDISNSLLYAFSYDGKAIWSKSILGSYSTPLIGSDSSVYVASQNNTFFALSHSGDTLWTTPINKMYSRGINIDREGNLYFVDRIDNYPNSRNSLKVLDKDGNILWTLSDDRILGTFYNIPTFSPDGSTIYIQGDEVSVLAIDINSQNVKWTFGDKKLTSSPVVDNAGNLYIIPGGEFETNRILYSLSPDGNINWKFNFISHSWAVNVEPTIDYNGNIYFGRDTLYSVSNSGKFRWKNHLDGGTIVSSLVCDKENTIYFGTTNIEKVFAFSSDGELEWKTDELPFRTLGACPAITDEGSLLFPTWRNYQISLSIIK